MLDRFRVVSASGRGGMLLVWRGRPEGIVAWYRCVIRGLEGSAL